MNLIPIKERIAVVVVTYNRLPLLQECLEGLRQQTCRPAEIFVINNGSTDGTAAWLATQVDLTIIHQANLGGAGGFHTGLKVAYEAGYDWIWVMDDDVEPTPTCLEDMLLYRTVSQCIHPSRVDQQGQPVKWEYLFDHTTGFVYETSLPEAKAESPYYNTNTACFEGMLIHRSIVGKIGFPDKRFFIVGDDTLYGFLASLHTPVICVRKALLLKKIRTTKVKLFGKGRIVDKPLFQYYFFRNAFLTREYLLKMNLIRRRFWAVYAFYFAMNIKNLIIAGRWKLLKHALRGGLDGVNGKF